MAKIRHAQATGTCPVCGAPQATWPDGVKRITCASRECHARWLAIRPAAHLAPSPAPELGVDALDTPPATDDGFTVTLVTG